MPHHIGKKNPTLSSYLQVVVQVELVYSKHAYHILLGRCFFSPIDSISLQPQRLNDWVGLETDNPTKRQVVKKLCREG